MTSANTPSWYIVQFKPNSHKIAVRNLQRLEWRGPHIEFLFCPIYHQKAINRDLSTSSVKSMIKSAAKRDGLNPSIVDEFSGHSLRVGAAQDLLRKGFDTAAIMRAGGWKSVNTLSRYLEKAEHNVWA